MIKIRPKHLVLSIASALALAIAAIVLETYLFEHRPFDSQKWKNNINSRSQMPLPRVEGMSKKEVLRILGKPDAEGTDKTGTSFIYLVPSGETKAAYCVKIQNSVVVYTTYDDSCEDLYKTAQ